MTAAGTSLRYCRLRRGRLGSCGRTRRKRFFGQPLTSDLENSIFLRLFHYYNTLTAGQRFAAGLEPNLTFAQLFPSSNQVAAFRTSEQMWVLLQAKRDELCIAATSSIDAHRYPGVRKADAQELQFPRKGQDAVPFDVRKACVLEASARLKMWLLGSLGQDGGFLKELGYEATATRESGQGSYTSGGVQRSFGGSVNPNAGAVSGEPETDFRSSPMFSLTAWNMLRPFFDIRRNKRGTIPIAGRTAAVGSAAQNQGGVAPGTNPGAGGTIDTTARENAQTALERAAQALAKTLNEGRLEGDILNLILMDGSLVQVRGFAALGGTDQTARDSAAAAQTSATEALTRAGEANDKATTAQSTADGNTTRVRAEERRAAAAEVALGARIDALPMMGGGGGTVQGVSPWSENLLSTPLNATNAPATIDLTGAEDVLVRVRRNEGNNFRWNEVRIHESDLESQANAHNVFIGRTNSMEFSFPNKTKSAQASIRIDFRTNATMQILAVYKRTIISGTAPEGGGGNTVNGITALRGIEMGADFELEYTIGGSATAIAIPIVPLEGDTGTFLRKDGSQAYSFQKLPVADFALSAPPPGSLIPDILIPASIARDSEVRALVNPVNQKATDAEIRALEGLALATQNHDIIQTLLDLGGVVVRVVNQNQPYIPLPADYNTAHKLVYIRVGAQTAMLATSTLAANATYAFSVGGKAYLWTRSTRRIAAADNSNALGTRPDEVRLFSLEKGSSTGGGGGGTSEMVAGLYGESLIPATTSGHLSGVFSMDLSGDVEDYLIEWRNAEGQIMYFVLKAPLVSSTTYSFSLARSGSRVAEGAVSFTNPTSAQGSMNITQSSSTDGVWGFYKRLKVAAGGGGGGGGTTDQTARDAAATADAKAVAADAKATTAQQKADGNETKNTQQDATIAAIRQLPEGGEDDKWLGFTGGAAAWLDLPSTGGGGGTTTPSTPLPANLATLSQFLTIETGNNPSWRAVEDPAYPFAVRPIAAKFFRENARVSTADLFTPPNAVSFSDGGAAQYYANKNDPANPMEGFNSFVIRGRGRLAGNYLRQSGANASNWRNIIFALSYELLDRLPTSGNEFIRLFSTGGAGNQRKKILGFRNGHFVAAIAGSGAGTSLTRTIRERIFTKINHQGSNIAVGTGATWLLPSNLSSLRNPKITLTFSRNVEGVVSSVEVADLPAAATARGNRSATVAGAAPQAFTYEVAAGEVRITTSAFADTAASHWFVHAEIQYDETFTRPNSEGYFNLSGGDAHDENGLYNPALDPAVRVRFPNRVVGCLTTATPNDHSANPVLGMRLVVDGMLQNNGNVLNLNDLQDEVFTSAFSYYFGIPQGCAAQVSIMDYGDNRAPTGSELVAMAAAYARGDEGLGLIHYASDRPLIKIAGDIAPREYRVLLANGTTIPFAQVSP